MACRTVIKGTAVFGWIRNHLHGLLDCIIPFVLCLDCIFFAEEHDPFLFDLHLLLSFLFSRLFHRDAYQGITDDFRFYLEAPPDLSQHPFPFLELCICPTDALDVDVAIFEGKVEGNAVPVVETFVGNGDNPFDTGAPKRRGIY